MEQAVKRINAIEDTWRDLHLKLHVGMASLDVGCTVGQLKALTSELTTLRALVAAADTVLLKFNEAGDECYSITGMCDGKDIQLQRLGISMFPFTMNRCEVLSEHRSALEAFEALREGE